MKPAPPQSTHRPGRRKSNLILMTATITGIIAAISIWQACHGPTPLNVATAIFTSLATAIESGLVPYTRRNEQKTAEYRELLQKMAHQNESTVR